MSAEVLKFEGNRFYKQGDYKRSIIKYSQAIEIDSGNPIYYGNRAAAYTSLSLFHSAIDDANKCIELDASYIKGYTRLAEVYKQIGDISNCIKQYGRAYINLSIFGSTSLTKECILKQIQLCRSKLDTQPKSNKNTKCNRADIAKIFFNFIQEFVCWEELYTDKNRYERVDIRNIFHDCICIYNIIHPEFEYDVSMSEIEYHWDKLFGTSAILEEYKKEVVQDIDTTAYKNYTRQRFQNSIKQKQILFPNFKISKSNKDFCLHKSLDEIFQAASAQHDLKHYATASELYKYCCNQHHIDSINAYALWYYSDEIVTHSHVHKFGFYMFQYVLFLDPHNGFALFNVAMIYFRGNIVTRNYDIAFDLVRKSIKDNRLKNKRHHFQSFYLLSTMYACGFGVIQDVELAKKYLKIGKNLQKIATSFNSYCPSFMNANSIEKMLHWHHNMNDSSPTCSQKEIDTRWDTLLVLLDEHAKQQILDSQQKYIFRVEEIIDIFRKCGYKIFGYNENTMKNIKCDYNNFVPTLNDTGIRFDIDPLFDWKKSGLNKMRICGNCDNRIDGKIFYCRNCGQAYCGKKCQKLDWHNHKQLCNLIRKGQKAAFSGNIWD